jgi:hypothetical protein
MDPPRDEFSFGAIGSRYEMKMVKTFPSSYKEPCYHPLFEAYVIQQFPECKRHKIEIDEHGFEGYCTFRGQLPCIPRNISPINHAIVLKQALEGGQEKVVEWFPVCKKHINMMKYLLANLAAWIEGRPYDPGFKVEPAPTSDV